MKQKRIALVLALVLVLLCLTACSSKLPDGFDKDDVLKKGETVVSQLTEKDYEAVYDQFGETLKSALTAEGLENALDAQLDKLGAFKKIKGTAVAGGKDDTIGEYAIAAIACSFENGSATFQISIAGDGTICGIYMK